MTAVDERPAVLAEGFPPPPPCPPWCDGDHCGDGKTTMSWHRPHYRYVFVDVEGQHALQVVVALRVADSYVGGRWSDRETTRLYLGPLAGSIQVDTANKREVLGLIAIAALISDDVANAVQEALQLADSPAVTPVPGADQ